MLELSSVKDISNTNFIHKQLVLQVVQIKILAFSFNNIYFENY